MSENDFLRRVSETDREAEKRREVERRRTEALREYRARLDQAWSPLIGKRQWEGAGGIGPPPRTGFIQAGQWPEKGPEAVCKLANVLNESSLANDARNVRDRIVAYLDSDPTEYEYRGVNQIPIDELVSVGICAFILCRAIDGGQADSIMQDAPLNRCTDPDHWEGLRLEIDCFDAGVPVEPAAIRRHTRTESEPKPQDAESTTADKVNKSDLNTVVLQVQKWSDLAIGIHENGAFYGVSPVPDHGTHFPIESATKLDLPPGRWTALLDLLAKSKEGTAALKRDLFIEFGYLTSLPSQEELADLRNLDGQYSKIKTAKIRLATSIGDLSRNLRKLVSAADDVRRHCPPLSAGDEERVEAQFTTRYLTRDRDGNLQFGGA